MGMGKVESEGVRVRFAGGYIPEAFQTEADAGIVAAFGEIPAMNFCGAGVEERISRRQAGPVRRVPICRRWRCRRE